MGITLLGIKDKPFCSSKELIEKLASKGVTFEKEFSKDDAIRYLEKNNNYYKLTSYRKNFPKDSNGKYIDLDFSYLVDMGIIDMLLRQQFIRMSLDIEHFSKVALLDLLKRKGDDGYSCIESYKSHLITQTYPDSDPQKATRELYDEIERNKKSIYCRDMLEHIHPGQRMPVWVFTEVVTFGRFCSFFMFCAKKYADAPSIEQAYRLKTVKSIRNAAGHNNCILNDMTIAKSKEVNLTADLNRKILNKFSNLFPKNPCTLRDKEPDMIQNSRIKEIITLFFVHSRILPSASMKEHYKKELQVLVNRMNRNIDNYKGNETIIRTFKIIETLVENWY